jgi:hypothetical protein
MVFIHPVILKEDLTDRYTQGKYRYIRSEQQRARDRAPFKAMPYPAQVMPPIEEIERPPGLEGERPFYPQELDNEAEASTTTANPEPPAAQPSEPIGSSNTDSDWWEPDY